MIYIITILRDSSKFNNIPLKIINLNNKSKHYFQGVMYALSLFYKEQNIRVEKIGTEVDYENGFKEVMCYFDSISDKEKSKLDVKLTKLGL